MSRVKKLTLSSILLACIVIILYLASLFPVMSLTLIAIAGLLTYVAIIECGAAYSLLMFIAASVLSFLLVPDKSCAVLYTLLLGIYPFIKHFAERIKVRALAWIVKILSANLLVLILYRFFSAVLLSFVPDDVLLIFAYLAFNAIFILFDVCITRLEVLYIWRIRRHIN